MTSFLVYPLPSIADETFLQVIFQGKVTRSLFAGFGKRRFALAEIANDTTFAAKLCLAIAPQNSNAGNYCKDNENNHDIQSNITNTGNKTELLQTWLSEVRDENVTLADLFNGPTLADILREGDNENIERQSEEKELLLKETSSKSDAKNKSKRKAKGKSKNVDIDDDDDDDNIHNFVNENHLEYLNHLFWRGQPVHVSLSHVNLDEFYTCGGVVPQHNIRHGKLNNKTKSNVNKNTSNKYNNINTIDGESKSTHTPLHYKQNHEGKGRENNNMFEQNEGRQESEEHEEHSRSVEHKQKNTKDGNVCQINSNNNNNSSSNNNNSVSTSVNNIMSSKRSRLMESSNFAKMQSKNTSVIDKIYPKDCCQKCGSADHFTRHCTANDIKNNLHTSDKEISNITHNNTITNDDSKVVKNSEDNNNETRKHKKSKHEHNDEPVTKTEHKEHATKHTPSFKTHDHHSNLQTEHICNAANVKANTKPKPTFIRTSKDQCKFCGSEEHLSRHCPSKTQ